MVEFSYRNQSENMVVLRCIGPDNFFLERVLFPAEVLVLLVPSFSKVEIWGNELYGPSLEQRFRIDNLDNDCILAA